MVNVTYDMTELQARVGRWVMACLGKDKLFSKQERAARVLEEALELFQATGLSRRGAHKLVDYVFDRSKGFVDQEAAGVGLTILGWAVCNGFSLAALICEELDRVEQPHVMSAVREKNAAKKAAGVGYGVSK
jgi:hypothetical protein